MFIRLLILTCAFVGCTGPQLSVFTEYLSIESLPSYQIGTPDPRLYDPDVGERLHIRWSVPPDCHFEKLTLHLSILFGDRQETEEWVTLETPTGIYVYPLLNEDYWNLGGIFTYKVELFGDDQLIQEWRHQLWADRLKITPADRKSAGG